MFGKQRSDVLVVGAGPTGLLAALHLAENDVKVRIVDKHWRTGAHSYALALHPRSLELLEPLGMVPTLLEHGRRVDKVSFWENGNQRAEISYSVLGGQYPFALVLPQSVLEGELENRLLKEKVRVQWNHRLEGVREEGNELTAEIAHLDRVAAGYPIARSEWTVVKTSKSLAKFVVGADGYHSHLRERMGIRFEQLGPLQTFSVFEFESDQDPGNELRVLFDGNLTSAFWPMQGNRCRWSFQISHPNQHEGTLVRLNEFVKARAPWFPTVGGEIIWTSMVQFDRRLATQLGKNRIWLAGDSAHLTSPVGVQSMNAGLVDAHELAWRLTELLTGDRGMDVLETYEPERMAELKPLFRLEGIELPEGADEWVGRLWPNIVSSVPATGKNLEALLSQLAG
jgi:2-polyprenyl-6-methoxyphenol hydroxylase-like FAD-dependent oxidoreductase